MKAVVTGGAGFIGSHITERLLRDGHEVVVIDDLSTGTWNNLPENRRLERVEGDVRDRRLLDRLLKGAGWVFHHAAIASVPRTVEDPAGSSQINYGGTLNVLEAARECEVERVVFASSAALYGDDPTLPKREDMVPVTLSPYAVDKLASEYACGMYSRLYGLPTVSLRYFNVYGPRQDPRSPYSGVISIFNDRLDAGITPTIFGDGEQTRDFVFVDDVVEANMLAVTSDAAVGLCMNVATGHEVNLSGLLKLFCEIKGKTFAVEHAESRQGDIRHSYADIGRASELLGWAPAVDLREGLRRLCAAADGRADS